MKGLSARISVTDITGGKCTYGAKCKFEHKCAICGKYCHGAHNCRRGDGTFDKKSDKRDFDHRDHDYDCKRKDGGHALTAKWISELIGMWKSNFRYNVALVYIYLTTNCWVIIFLTLADNKAATDQEPVEYGTNFDLDRVCTPVDADEFHHLLHSSGYDSNETNFIIEGFRNGFPLEYQGPWQCRDTASNIPFSVGDRVDMWNKLMKEVKLGRVAGPYEHVPFDYFVQSPIGLVPKAGNKTRLIFHLSHDFKSGHKSINFWTPQNLCMVKYNDLDHAVCNSIGWMVKWRISSTSKMPLFYSKTDFQSTFRVLPVSPHDWPYLVMWARDPLTLRWFYFVDKCLPFGASISCSHFQRVSDAIQNKLSITNYLDDFLFVHPLKDQCDKLVEEFLEVCKLISFLVAHGKTKKSTTQIVFLSILIDGTRKCLAISHNKLVRALYMVNHMKDKKKATVKEIQWLAGHLNFLNRAIHPGRAFMWRMFAKYSKLVNGGMTLKHYHHVHLDAEFRKDCEVWALFLAHQEAVNRPFIDHLTNDVMAQELLFATDASRNAFMGFGCVFNKNWTFGVWEPGYIKKFQPSIAYLELYALCMGIYVWQQYLQNVQIIVFCDNQADCSMVNSLASSCKNCMYLIRKLTLNNLVHKRCIFLKFIPSKQNSLADSLSRGQMARFWKLAKELGRTMNLQPAPLHPDLWPPSRIWLKGC